MRVPNPSPLEASAALLQVLPDWDGSFYFRGKALAKAGQFAKAIEAYEKALELEGPNQEAIRKALEEARAKQKDAQTPPAPTAPPAQPEPVNQ